MSKAKRANELYPTNKFVATIARAAYIKGFDEATRQIRAEVDARRENYCNELMGHAEDPHYHRLKGMYDGCLDLLTYIDNSMV